MVPATGRKVGEEAVRMACRMGRQDGAKVQALYVIELGHEYPLDANLPRETAAAESVLERIDALCHEERCPADTALVQARHAGPSHRSRGDGQEYRPHRHDSKLQEGLPSAQRNCPIRAKECHLPSPAVAWASGTSRSGTLGDAHPSTGVPRRRTAPDADVGEKRASCRGHR